MAKTARIEVRTDPEREALLKQAASLTNQPLTSFVLDAAEQRAKEVVAEANTTVVPSTFFDELLLALDDPPQSNEAMRKAARQAQPLVEQRRGEDTRSRHDESIGSGRTWVWTEAGAVFAYFTLVGHVIEREVLPRRLGRGSPEQIP